MFLPSNITLKFGDSGDFVSELQRRLAMVGCFDESQVNGFFDGNTVNGVTRFQGMNGLHADGVAGPETLRRLNGVIAGDTSGSSTSSAQEEEAARAAQNTNVLNQWLIDQPAAVDPTFLSPAAPAHEPAPAVAAEPQAVYAPPAPPPIAPLAPPPMDHAILHAPAPPQNDLAAMLLAQPPAPQAMPLEQQPREHTRPPMQEVPPQQQYQQQPAFQPPAQPPHETAPEPMQAEPQGIIGKTMRFANAMMQKVADYFEAKLPPTVLKEVQNIGLNMAQHGVKEAPIPTGPEMGGQAQTPARGPEQQAGIQRG